MELANCQTEWIRFLKYIVSEGESGDAAGVLLKHEQAAADTIYFKRNVTEGNLKKCPKCKRLIEKMQGCDSMVFENLSVYYHVC